jgi:uncharacterized protein (DUF302 family)
MIPARIDVEHVRQFAGKPFRHFTATFEQQLGRFDPNGYPELGRGGDPAVVRATLESMAGPSGFMLFTTNDHGTLLRLVGKLQNARQYVLGNPLFAIEMTRHAIGAGLYVPLRVLIYEDEDGTTWVEYDRPSSLLGQFGDPRIDRMAASLDQKLEALLAASAR